MVCSYESIGKCPKVDVLLQRQLFANRPKFFLFSRAEIHQWVFYFGFLVIIKQADIISYLFHL